VIYKKDRAAFFLNLFYTGKTFTLEGFISYRESFIDNQNIRFYADGNSKIESDEHAAGIRFNWLIDKISYIYKGYNIIKTFIYLLLPR
jgi:hypothetical protein